MEAKQSNNDLLPHPECESRLHAIMDALYVLSGKWKLPIIVSLLDQSKRFNELQRSLQSISAKVLSAELKELELNGFVERKVLQSMPFVIEYRLTGYAKSLDPVLRTLGDWGRAHRQRIRETMQAKRLDAIRQHPDRE